MSKKIFPSLQFINRDRMSLLLTPPPNGRSMPLKGDFSSFILIHVIKHCFICRPSDSVFFFVAPTTQKMSKKVFVFFLFYLYTLFNTDSSAAPQIRGFFSFFWWVAKFGHLLKKKEGRFSNGKKISIVNPTYSTCTQINVLRNLYTIVLKMEIKNLTTTTRIHCVGGCWDRTQDCCDFVNDSCRRSNHLGRSHPQ
jgi:hypothetical protein